MSVPLTTLADTLQAVLRDAVLEITPPDGDGPWVLTCTRGARSVLVEWRDGWDFRIRHPGGVEDLAAPQALQRLVVLLGGTGG